MITKTIKHSIILFVFLAIAGTGRLYSQTTGNFAFTVTTTSTGGYSPRNLIAIWIRNSSNAFIKTKILYCSSGNLDHLATWTGNSGGNVVSATTGATRTSHGLLSILWDGTNVSGTVVPDGAYNVWLEMAWADNLSTGKTVNNYPFTKGATAFSSNPANTANFLGMSLTWTPGTTGVEKTMQNSFLKAYPNPSSGNLNIEFKSAFEEGLIQILNEAGVLVFQEKLYNITPEVRTFDLSAFPPGAYYVTVHLPEKDIVFRIIRIN